MFKQIINDFVVHYHWARYQRALNRCLKERMLSSS